MVVVHQGIKMDLHRVNPFLNKIKYKDVNLNSELLREDMEKIRTMLKGEDSHTRGLKRNALQYELTYLERLDETFVKKKNSITWFVQKDELRMLPLDLKFLEIIDRHFIDYIDQEDKEIVELRFDKLCEVIAFDFLYLDLGYTLDEIESYFREKNVGIVTTQDSKHVYRFITEDLIQLAKVFKVDDSPAITPDNENLRDYFNRQRFDRWKYWEAIRHSWQVAIVYVLSSHIDTFVKNNVSLEMCYVNDTSVVFIAKDASKKLIEIIDEVSVRTFGRKFCVKPTIEKLR